MPAQIVLTAPRSELGRILTARLGGSPPAGKGTVVVNLALQPANTLLHDGRAWRRLRPARILASTREALARADELDAFLVHASFAMLASLEAGEVPGASLRPLAEALLEAEAMVLERGSRAGVVRLGYLYGPELADLRAYRLAFRLHRPYWAGPADVLQHHLSTEDAATALLAAAARRAPGVTTAVSGEPASFAALIDDFAHRTGTAHPRHIPLAFRPISRFIVGTEHMDTVALPAARDTGPGVDGFSPRHVSHTDGMAAVAAEWQRAKG